MLTKNDTVRVRGVNVPVVINCNIGTFRNVITVSFFCSVDGINFSRQYKTVTNDKNFYQDFKAYVDDKLTIADIVETRLKNKGFTEVIPDAP